jgi:protein tyrosine/serine phosphatase
MVYIDMRTNPTNFREIRFGKIAPNVLYRSGHPIQSGEQVKDIILHASDAGIETILNLSDCPSLLKSEVIFSPWYNKIFMKNNVIALDMPMNFDVLEDEFVQKLKRCIIFMIERDPPYLIHCKAGIDRTGFISMILEAFMDAGFRDIVKDYMTSFIYDGEFSEDDYWTAAPIVISSFTRVKGDLIKDGDDLKDITEKYLTEKVGLTDKDLMRLEYKLMKRDI